MSVADEIRQCLQLTFAPDLLEVHNESAAHAGHAGDDGSGESHFRVRIKAEALTQMSRIARHRAIHEALGPEIIGRIHALSLQVES